MDLKVILNKRLQLSGQNSQTIPLLLAHIDELNVKWDYEAPTTQKFIARVKKSVVVTSTGASNRIENINLADKEVQRLLLQSDNRRKLNSGEAAGLGYLEVLELITKHFGSIDISVNQILSLHRRLLEYSDTNNSHKGEFKNTHNRIVAKDQMGKEIGILHTPTEPYLVGSEIAILVNWLNTSLNTKIAHPLLIIANFIIEFLAIHPFLDGNGRISRLLTILLMLKSGYRFVGFASHESLIEQTRLRYYLNLQQGQSNWRSEIEDISGWYVYFLEIVNAQANEAFRVASSPKKELSLSQNQQAVFGKVRDKSGISKREIAYATGINPETVKQALQKLVKLGLVTRTGEGRAVIYWRKQV